jgi:hypothetical protein
MARKAGIYKIVWKPQESGITRARHLIKPLRKAIAKMIADPERFKKFNDKNGWGTYENLVPWLKKYLAACKSMPDAAVSSSW